MPIDVNPTSDEVDELHDDLKAYEAALAAYLNSADGQNDPNCLPLSKLDINLNLKIYNLSVQSLQISADQTGAAVDAINKAVAELKSLQTQKAAIASDLQVVQSVVTFVGSLVAGNASGIVQSGAALYSLLQQKSGG